MGNAINSAGMRRGMGISVSTMNVRTTDTVSSVLSSNITTPGAGGQVTNSVPQAYPFPCNIFESMAIPPLGKFNGKNESEPGKLFTDWIEQFELQGQGAKRLLFIGHLALNNGIIIQFL